MEERRGPAPISCLTGLAPEALAAFGDALRTAGYDDHILGEGERVAPNLVDRLRLPLVHRALERNGTPAARLALLFVYDGMPPAASVHDALGPETVSALLDAGVLVAEGDALRARFRLLPFGDVWVFSDDPAAGRDAVMGAGPATMALARLLPERIEGRFLDLGCGAGALALFAARRGADAMGTDLNPRATAMGRVNAALNRLPAEFDTGDLLEPVRGRRFDVVIAQPPFVIQPESQEAVTYVHGGPRGDAIVGRLVSVLSEALAPGGWAAVRFDAAVGPDEQIHDRVRGWLDGAPLDLALLTTRAPSPDAIALGYAALEDPTLGAAYAESARRYREHIDLWGITEFHQALALLRAGRDGNPGGRFGIQLPVRTLAGIGPAAIEVLFASLDLATADSGALLRAAVRPSPGARFVEVRSAPGAVDPALTVRFAPGAIGVEGELNPATLRLLELLGGAGSVAEALERHRADPASGAGGDREAALDFVRQGLAEGLLVPAGFAPKSPPG